MDRINNWVSSVTPQHQHQPGHNTSTSWGHATTSDDEHQRRALARGSSSKTGKSPRSSGRRQQQQQFSTSFYQQQPPQQQSVMNQSMPNVLPKENFIIYNFTGAAMPYKVRCLKPAPTLGDVKEANPRRNNKYRYFFTSRYSGQFFREEVSENADVVPMKEPGVVEVTCEEL